MSKQTKKYHWFSLILVFFSIVLAIWYSTMKILIPNFPEFMDHFSWLMVTATMWYAVYQHYIINEDLAGIITWKIQTPGKIVFTLFYIFSLSFILPLLFDCIFFSKCSKFFGPDKIEWENIFAAVFAAYFVVEGVKLTRRNEEINTYPGCIKKRLMHIFCCTH